MGKIKIKKKNMAVKSDISAAKKTIKKKKNKSESLLTKDMIKFMSKASKSDVGNVTKVDAKKGKPENIKKSVDSKSAKKKSKNVQVCKGDDFPEEMRKELEVFIKNLNRGGQIEKGFVVDEGAVENDANDEDVVSVDGNYEDVDDDFDVKQEVEVKKENEEGKNETKKDKKKKKKERKQETNPSAKPETEKQKLPEKNKPKKEKQRGKVKPEASVEVKKEDQVSIFI